MYRRFTLFSLFLAGLIPCLIHTPEAAAQAEENTRKLAFKSHDEVTLQGVLYKSKKGGNSPTVLMMHSYGVDPNKGDWAGLAKTLAAEGYNVLRFDFRGHGDSKIVNTTKFWADPINLAFLPSLARKRADTIDVKNFPGRDGGDYFPRLADDVMAARVALDQLNDNSEVNTRSIYLIGSTDAVVNGFLYLTAEWSRPQKMPPFAIGMGNLILNLPTPNGLNGLEPAALDVAGAVWLSPTKHRSVSDRLIQQWVQAAPELRERTPMLFIAGEQDRIGRYSSKFYLDQVLAAAGGGRLPKLPLTQGRLIKGTKLTGADLLGKSLGTEKMIVDYLNALEKERLNLIRVTNRGFSSPPPINLPYFGVAKP